MSWLSAGRAVLLAAGCMGAAAAQGTQVQEDFRRGAAAMHRGDSAAAEAAFRDAVRVAPEMAEAHLDLGLVLGREGKMAEAIASLRRSLSLDPKQSSAHMFLGIFLYQNNEAEAARKEIQSEVDQDPKNAEALIWLGTVEMSQGHPERAVQSFDRAAELTPDDLNLLEFRGKAHNLVAKDSYARMARLDPGSWHVHRVQAQLYADEGRHADAITELQAAIKQQPRNPDLYEDLGDEYRATSQLETAEEAYRKGLELGPANPIALYNLGSIEVERGDSAAGVPRLLAMTKIYPGSPVAEYYLGRGLAVLGREEEAIPWLRQGAAGGGSSEIAKRSYYELTRVYRKLHRAEEEQAALGDYNRLRLAEEKQGKQQVQDWKKLSETATEGAAPPAGTPPENGR